MLTATGCFYTSYSTKKLLEELHTGFNSVKHSRVSTAENSLLSLSHSVVSTPIMKTRPRKNRDTIFDFSVASEHFPMDLTVSSTAADLNLNITATLSPPLKQVALTPNHFMNEVLEKRLKTPKSRHMRSVARPNVSWYNALYCGYKQGKHLPFHDPSKVLRVFQNRPIKCTTLQIPRPQSVSSIQRSPDQIQTLELKLTNISRDYLKKHEFDKEALGQVRVLYESIRKREIKFSSCRANSILDLEGQMQAIAEFLIKYQKKLEVKEAVFQGDCSKRERLVKFERFLLHLQRDVFL